MRTLASRLPTAACLTLLAMTSAALAAEPADGLLAAAGVQPVTATATVASQYVARGFRQTSGKPAAQAGIDVSTPGGWTFGAWASNVSGRHVENATVELDLYGGHKGSLGPLGYGVTATYHSYPGAVVSATGTRYDYGELSAGLSYKALFAKYHYTFTRDFFGIRNARGTAYLDGGANIALGPSTMLNLHMGEGRVAGAGNDYWNWRDVKVGVTRRLAGGLDVAAAFTRAFGATHAYERSTTGARNAAGRVAYSNPGKSTLVLSLTKTF